jgi:hypothetical protein
VARLLVEYAQIQEGLYLTGIDLQPPPLNRYRACSIKIGTKRWGTASLFTGDHRPWANHLSSR